MSLADVVLSVLLPHAKPMTFVFASKYGPRKHVARSVVGDTAVVHTTADGHVVELVVALVGVTRERPVVSSFPGSAFAGCRWSLADARAPLMQAAAPQLHALIEANASPSPLYSNQYRKDLVDGEAAATARARVCVVPSPHSTPCCSLFVGGADAVERATDG